MKYATDRAILRWVHILASIPILGYIYSPFEELPKYAPKVRLVIVPLLIASGLWMWKGAAVRRLIYKLWARDEMRSKPLTRAEA